MQVYAGFNRLWYRVKWKAFVNTVHVLGFCKEYHDWSDDCD